MKTMKRKFTLSRNQFLEMLEIANFAIRQQKSVISGLTPSVDAENEEELKKEQKNLRLLRSFRIEMRGLL